jgi:putative methionine-R-sulfoxide reductase with GAF domain
VPIDAGHGIVGVLYADSLTVPDVFRPDDMAVLRAFANLIAVAIALG